MRQAGTLFQLTPTPAMLEAGAEVLLDAGDASDWSCHDLAARVFVAMTGGGTNDGPSETKPGSEAIWQMSF